MSWGVDFAQMGQCSSHLHSSSVGLLVWGLFSTRACGMGANLGGVLFSACSVLIPMGASVGGIGQDALASNKFVEVSMVLDHRVSSLCCGAVAVNAASGCCLSWGLLQLGVEGPFSSWGLPVG